MSSFSINIIVLAENSRKFPILTRSNTTVIKLKQQIAEQLQIQVGNIRLCFSEVELVDNKELSYYSIQAEDSICLGYVELKPKIVTVMGFSGAATSLSVFSGDTAAKFIERYKKKAGTQDGIALIHSGQELRNDQKFIELDLDSDPIFNIVVKASGGFHTKSF